MVIFLWFTGALVAVVAGFILYRLIAFHVGHWRINRTRQRRIRPLADRLLQGQALTTEEILPFIHDRKTRQDAFQLLFGHDQLQLVPEEYNNLTSSAEGQLAIWLEFPTELDALPDEMRYMGRVLVGPSDDGYEMIYEVFQFCKHEPHWAAKDGWMIGWSGPFEDDGMFPTEIRAFSRFSKLTESDPEKEVLWYASKIAASDPRRPPPPVRFIPTT